jgi:hypothetical protein
MEDTPIISKQQARLAASDMRDKLVKDLVQKERADSIAKTAKLRALRLAKEAAEGAAPQAVPARKKRAARGG